MTSDVVLPMGDMLASEALAAKEEKKRQLLSMVDNAETVKNALGEGIDRQSVAKALADTKKIPEEEADRRVVEYVSDIARENRDRGATDDMILQALKSKNYDPSLHDIVLKQSALPKSYKKQALPIKEQVTEAKDLVASYNNIYNSYSTHWQNNVLGLLSDTQAAEAQKSIHQLNLDIIQRLKEDGFNASLGEDGTPLIDTGNGVLVEATPTFFQGLSEQQGELSLGASGSMLGTSAGALIGSLGGPPGIVAGMTVGGLLGGSTGASIGRGFDIYVNSLELKEKLEDGLMQREMIEAGVHDAVMGYLTGKAVEYGAVPAVKGTYNAYKYLVGGNEKAALTYLKEALHITDEAAEEILSRWRAALDKAPTRRKLLSFKGINKEVELNKTQQTTLAILETQKGAENVLREAIGNNLTLANTLLKNVTSRAKSVHETVAKMSDPNVGKVVKEDFEAYVKDIKDYYASVKDTAVDAIDGTDYSFNVEKLGIKPALDILIDSADSTARKERLINILSKIENKTASREFSDLLDFRASINSFKYETSKLKYNDKKLVNNVLDSVNKEIKQAAKKYMSKEEAKNWIYHYEKANKSYSDMLKLTEDAMHNKIVDAVKTEENLQKTLVEWSTNKQINVEELNKVMERLSPYARSKTEVAAIKAVLDKHTYGNPTDFHAVDFPMVSRELEGLAINNAEGKFLKQSIDGLAKIFQNDAQLGAVSGRLRAPSSSQVLSSDPVQIAKLKVVRGLTDTVMSFLPNDAGRRRSLFNMVPKLFENPLDYKASQQFLSTVPVNRRDTMRSLLKEYQIEVAKRGPPKPQSFVRLYQKSKDGSVKTTTGKWGSGQYFSNKILNKNPGDNVVGKEINVDKLATLDDIKRVLSNPNITNDNLAKMRNMKGFQERLQRSGFLGIKDGEKYMLFPEKTK